MREWQAKIDMHSLSTSRDERTEIFYEEEDILGSIHHQDQNSGPSKAI